MLSLIRWLLGGSLDCWWPLRGEARRVLAEFGIESPSDLADAPQALAYALRSRCTSQDIEILREIAASYPVAFYL